MANLIFLTQHPVFLIFILTWTLAWKGIALWKAAQRRQVYWFITLLVINTIGILPILYVYLFSEWKTIKVFKKKHTKTNEESTKEE